MKFTLRDLFWLVLTAALVVGWWTNHRVLIRESQSLKEQLMASATVPIDGEIVALHASRTLVEVSIGTDEGLRAGSIMHVHRGRQQVGQITILELEPDRSVARIDSMNNNKAFREGDRVTSAMRVPLVIPAERR